MAHGCVWIIDASGTERHRIDPDGRRRARHLPEPRRDTDLRQQPRARRRADNTGPSRRRARLGQRDRSDHRPGRRHVADPGRRIAGHGRRLRRRHQTVAVGPLSTREVYVFDTATGELVAPDHGPARTTRTERLPATRPLLARPHRQLPMNRRDLLPRAGRRRCARRARRPAPRRPRRTSRPPRAELDRPRAPPRPSRRRRRRARRRRLRPSGDPPSTRTTVPPAPSTADGAVPSRRGRPANRRPTSTTATRRSALVALTFHFAGDPALVTRLLDLLKANSVRSTLFAIGDWLTAHPALGHRALADGHELGNHTKSHQPMLELDRAHVHAEIAGGGDALVPFIGSIGNVVPAIGDRRADTTHPRGGRQGRLPGVGRLRHRLPRLHRTRDRRRVIDNVTPHLHPGAIVSLHFGHHDTLDRAPTDPGPTDHTQPPTRNHQPTPHTHTDPLTPWWSAVFREAACSAFVSRSGGSVSPRPPRPGRRR